MVGGAGDADVAGCLVKRSAVMLGYDMSDCPTADWTAPAS